MKIELHTHTSEISFCGRLTVDELVELYAGAGYDALVIANHFNFETVEKFKGGGDFVEAFWEVLDRAAELGREKGILVLPGMEIRFGCSVVNDYLVYGMTKELSRDLNYLCSMTPKEFSEFAGNNGILFYQAHPFRNNMQVIPPEYLFGIEVQNTHPRHDSRNEIALAWAEKYNLHKIAGSDCHQIEDVGSSAIITDYEVRNIQDLVHVLKNDMYEIVKC